MSEYNEKKVLSVEIHNLNEIGYGYDGSYTRRAWRTECLEYLLRGKDEFRKWQESWQDKIITDLPHVDFYCVLNYNDYASERFLDIGEREPYTLDFIANLFENNLNCSEFDFMYPVDFSKAVFSNFANFEDAKFHDAVGFQWTKFYYSHFQDAIFYKTAYFNSTEYSEWCSFHNATFHDYSEFASAKFASNVNFNKAKFSDVLFSDAKFFDRTEAFDIGFSDVEFNGYADFENAEFSYKVNFRRTKFKYSCNFLCAKFHRNVNFENASFDCVGHFEKAIFNYMPSFRGCSIENTRLEFSDERHFSNRIKIDQDEEEIVKNISYLKRLSEQHGQLDQALEFNAMELEAKPFNLITWFYKTLSNYGRSFVRPLMWYIGLILFTLGLGLWFSYTTVPPVKPCDKNISCYIATLEQKNTTKKPEDIALSALRATFEYSLYRATGGLDFTDSDKETSAVTQRLFGSDIEPDSMRAFGVFKAIVSLLLLFLMALGLRNKYRIK